MPTLRSAPRSYMAVLATLKFQFAKTLAFAIAIASSVRMFAMKLFAPLLGKVLHDDVKHW